MTEYICIEISAIHPSKGTVSIAGIIGDSIFKGANKEDIKEFLRQCNRDMIDEIISKMEKETWFS